MGHGLNIRNASAITDVDPGRANSTHKLLPPTVVANDRVR